MKIYKIMQNYTKIFSLLLVALFLISFASSALATLGPVKQGETIRVPQICNDATFVTIASITYPNGSVAVSNQSMVYFGNSEWYYNFSLTSALGTYKISEDSDGCEGTATYYFEVTPTGVPGVSGGQSSLLGILIISLIVIACVLFYLSYKFQNKSVRVFTIVLAFLIIFFDVGIVMNASNTYLFSTPGIVSNYEGFYLLLVILGSTVGFSLIVWLIYYVFKTFNKVRGLSGEDE